MSQWKDTCSQLSCGGERLDPVSHVQLEEMEKGRDRQH